VFFILLNSKNNLQEIATGSTFYSESYCCLCTSSVHKWALRCLPSLWAPAQIPSGENQMKLTQNSDCGKRGISKKLSIYQVWLSHLTPAMVGGAHLALQVHCLFCTGHHRKLPRVLWRLDQYSIINVMHCQQFQLSNWPDNDICPPMHEVAMNNTLFFQIVHSVAFAQLFPWLESAPSICSALVAGKATLAWADLCNVCQDRQMS
jgi:hypothetical protein